MAMSPLVRELLLKGLVAGTAVRQAKKTSVGAIYYGLAGGVGLLAFVYFSIAGYALLQESFTTPAAAAITGGVILLISATIALFGNYHLNKKKLVKKPSMDGSFLDTVEGTIKSLLDGFEEPIRDNPKAALIMAALAGFAAGDKLGDRVH
jgi:hypothetical protein